MKWTVTKAFFVLAFGVLSYNAFIATDFSSDSNLKSVSVVITFYNWLLITLGPIQTGLFFAVCVLGALAFAWPSKKTNLK